MMANNESIRYRRDLKIKWYRSPMDKSVLQELHERSDIKGFIQTTTWQRTWSDSLPNCENCKRPEIVR